MKLKCADHGLRVVVSYSLNDPILEPIVWHRDFTDRCPRSYLTYGRYELSPHQVVTTKMAGVKLLRWCRQHVWPTRGPYS